MSAPKTKPIIFTEPDLIREDEACAICGGISKGTLASWETEGYIPRHKKMGSVKCWHRRQFREALDQHFGYATSNTYPSESLDGDI